VSSARDAPPRRGLLPGVCIHAAVANLGLLRGLFLPLSSLVGERMGAVLLHAARPAAVSRAARVSGAHSTCRCCAAAFPAPPLCRGVGAFRVATCRHQLS
jgi:hypothetical protein